MSTIWKCSHAQLTALLPEVAFADDLEAAVAATVRAMYLVDDGDEVVSDSTLQVLVDGLTRALDRFQFSDTQPLPLLRQIRCWALEFLEEQETATAGTLLFPTGLLDSPVLDDNVERAVATRVVTARQARGVLANALFGNCRDVMKEHKEPWNGGGLDWRPLLRGSAYDTVGVERMRCHLLYFATMMSLEGEEDDDDARRVIVFERIRYKPRKFLKDLTGEAVAPFVGAGIVLHDAVMERPTRPATAIINFANPNFGYGKFIRSATQEEILESCCPEFTVGLLWMGLMKKDEVVVVRNVRRFAQYSGYLKSFRCEGPVDSQKPVIQDILTMDACYRDHFSDENVERDLNKAYFCFRFHASAVATQPVISTGKWGCGAFGGTAAHKFVQQVLAANLAGVDLDFSAFGDPEACDDILRALLEHKPSAARVARALAKSKRKQYFVKDFIAQIRPGMLQAASTWLSGS